MKLNTDKITTWIGVVAGCATIAAQSGALDPHMSQMIGSGAGFAIAILGYFTNKSKP